MFGINIGKLNFPAGAGKRELIGMDLGAGTLKIARMKTGSGNSQIVNLLSRDISGLSDDGISKTFLTCLSELKAKNPSVIDIIPSNLVITKNIEIPSTDPKEIKEIINLQAGRHTPYSREEIIVDYVDIDIYKHNYTKILLVIVARNVVKRHFDILAKAGVKLEKVFFAPEGLAKSITRIPGPGPGPETGELPVSIVHIDEEFSDFAVVFRDKTVFVRTISIGTRHLTAGGEECRLRFAEEVKKSLETYQNEDIEKNPASLVLTGAVEEIKNLDTLLNEVVRLPVRAAPYLQKLPFSDEALQAASLSKHLSFLSISAALTCREEMKMNFIPEDIKLRRSLEDRGRELIKAGIFSLSVFVSIFFILISNIYFKNAYLKNLNTKYKSLNQEAQKLEEDFAKAAIIREYLLKRGYSLEVLTELHDITPVDMELDDIRFDEQGRFSIKGTAESMSIIFSFVDKMEKSKYFKEVKTKYTTKRKQGSKDVTDFEIACLLKKELGR